MVQKSGSAKWSGDLKTGTGSISTQTGALKDHPYGFKARFEGGPGSNPEELIAAAHASCFSMALSMMLGEAGMTADSIETKATVTLEEKDGGFAVTKSHLDVTVKVPGAAEDDVMAAAKKAKEGCPISKLLNAEITMDAKVL